MQLPGTPVRLAVQPCLTRMLSLPLLSLVVPMRLTVTGERPALADALNTPIVLVEKVAVTDTGTLTVTVPEDLSLAS